MAHQWYWPPDVGALEYGQLIQLVSTLETYIEASSDSNRKQQVVPVQAKMNAYTAPAGPPLFSVSDGMYGRKDHTNLVRAITKVL